MNGIFFQEPIENAHIADILEEIYMNRLYQPYLANRHDLTILDVGANVGIFSYYASQFGKVYALEPAKEHVKMMKEMLSYNGLQEKVGVYPIALSNVDGETSLAHSGNITSHSLHPAIEGAQKELGFGSEKVETCTIKTFLDKEKIETVDFMKLDVEGWEFQILSSKEFEECAPRIKEIVGEWHAWTETKPVQLTNMLRDYGYKAEWLSKSEASIFHAVRP